MRTLWAWTTLCLAASLSPTAAATSALLEPPGAVTINEIELGASDWIEIHNWGTGPAILTGWELRLSDASGWSATYTFPTFTLDGGAYLVVHEGGSAADDTASALHTSWNMEWANGLAGAAELLTWSLGPADYVEFGQDPSFAPAHAESWLGSYGAVTPDTGRTLGREVEDGDTDRYDDWCGQAATPGGANGACTCSAMYNGQAIVSTTLYETWPTDEVFEACDTFSLSFADPDEYPPATFPPFSLEPGVTFTVRAGRAVVLNPGTNIPNGASLTIEIDPQLRQ